MKGGAKVIVEPHRHEGIFIAKQKEDAAALGAPGRTTTVGRRTMRPSMKPLRLLSVISISEQRRMGPTRGGGGSLKPPSIGRGARRAQRGSSPEWSARRWWIQTPLLLLEGQHTCEHRRVMKAGEGAAPAPAISFWVPYELRGLAGVLSVQ